MTSKAQVCGRPVGLLLGLRLSLNPFSTHAAYRELAALSFPERLARLREPELRERLVSEEPGSENPFTKWVLGNFEKMYPLGDPPECRSGAQ